MRIAFGQPPAENGRILSQPPLGPDAVPLRLFVTQTLAVIANFVANPTLRSGRYANACFHAILKNPAKVTPLPTDIDLLRSTIAAAVPINMRVVPGFRIFPETTNPYAAADPVAWKRAADNLRLIMAIPEYASSSPGQYVAFDIEDYSKLQVVAPSYDAQRVAMTPFLLALVELRVVPCIYPAAMDGVTGLITLALGDAMAGRFQFWTESGFGLSERIRLGTANALEISQDKVATLARRRWHNAVVRPGEQDHFFRDWGEFGRQDLSVYGSHNPWIFDELRTDDALIGTPAYQDGSSLSTCNDIYECWRMGANHAANVVSAKSPTGQSLIFTQTLPLGTQRSDLRSSLGHLHFSGGTLSALNWITAGALAFGAFWRGVLPPTGEGPIFGNGANNFASWQVRYRADQDQIVLSVRQGASFLEYVMVSAPAKGTSISLGVALGGGVWRYGDALTATPPIAVSSGAGQIYLAQGVATLGVSPLVLTAFEGLVSQSLQLIKRNPTALEFANMRVHDYPRVT